MRLMTWCMRTEKLIKQDLKDKIKPEQSEKINKAASDSKMR